MFNPTTMIIDAFTKHLIAMYQKIYGRLEPDYPQIISFVAQLALEKIANSDAPYHNLNHTILVTDVGLEIIKGKHIRNGKVSPKDWLHFTISLLCHDIGYLRSICAGDSTGRYQIDTSGTTVSIPRGSTDAALTPYHVTRSKIFVEQRFGHVDIIDVEIIKKNIEYTRFPIPASQKNNNNFSDYPGLLCAADLIGQMADINYPNKIGVLYSEFLETGTAEQLGYQSAADLKEAYPGFFWQHVSPLIQDAIVLLQETQEGKQWVANLYANVFAEEHHLRTFGSEK